MDYDSLTRYQRRLADETLRGSHRREVELVVIRRHDGKRILSLTNQFLGGSIQGDASEPVPTGMECDIFDEDVQLNWSHGAHRKFMVRVIVGWYVPDLDDWVEYIIHTGPIWSFYRQGPVVHLEVDGPEWNAMGSIREADSDPARTKATTVIRKYLRKAGANPRDMRIPNLKATLPRDVTVGVRRGKDRNKKKDGYQGPKRQVLRVDREDTYLGVVDPIAEAIDRELFTNGRGKFILAKPLTRPSFAFTNRMLTGEPSEKPATSEELPNTWIVLGADPKGPRKRVTGRAELPRRHNASAWSQRWNGTPRPVIVEIENDHVRSRKAANRLADRHRDRAARETTEFEVEVLPCLLWVRPNMLVSVPTTTGRAMTRVRSWSIPLGPGPDPVTLGTTRRRGR